MRTKVYCTAKGSEMKANTWIEGQEIEMSTILAEHLIESGVVSKTLEVKEKEVKLIKKDKK